MCAFFQASQYTRQRLCNAYACCLTLFGTCTCGQYKCLKNDLIFLFSRGVTLVVEPFVIHLKTKKETVGKI